MARIRRGRRKRPPSHVGGLGSKATQRGTTSRVGGLGSKAGSQPRTIREPTPQPFQRQRYRIRRPRQRRPYGGVSIGVGYPRRYRARPMSSGGCLAVIIILAIFWLIFLAPSITISLDATLSLVLPILVVIGFFVVAIWFITRIVDDNSGSTQVKVIEHEKILVVCPYCGAKNEQGVTTCINCDAEI
ncbi:zinc ribbon domain-containing protein [Candidatus Thorarchaeota archaeon]|nr:MAG: zinc ribbon domain-containing protein [Candidatus Thorarchaeota archaeon]